MACEDFPFAYNLDLAQVRHQFCSVANDSRVNRIEVGVKTQEGAIADPCLQAPPGRWRYLRKREHGSPVGIYQISG